MLAYCDTKTVDERTLDADLFDGVVFLAGIPGRYAGLCPPSTAYEERLSG